jgi:hypothetical protein
MLMHVLSPYPAHRSALTDCQKLVRSDLPGRKAIVVFGYDYNDWPMNPRSKRLKRSPQSALLWGTSMQRPMTISRTRSTNEDVCSLGRSATGRARAQRTVAARSPTTCC